jgi:hypothetical protein
MMIGGVAPMTTLMGFALIYFALFAPAFFALLLGMDSIIQNIASDWVGHTEGKK